MGANSWPPELLRDNNFSIWKPGEKPPEIIRKTTMFWESWNLWGRDSKLWDRKVAGVKKGKRKTSWGSIMPLHLLLQFLLIWVLITKSLAISRNSNTWKLIGIISICLPVISSPRKVVLLALRWWVGRIYSIMNPLRALNLRLSINSNLVVMLVELSLIGNLLIKEMNYPGIDLRRLREKLTF